MDRQDSRDENDAGPDGAKIQRACDPCRARKVRCDRERPCSNCKASKLNCQTTAPAQKTQRQRVHISDEYEKKIDRIEDRLAGIEHVLEALASKLGNLDISRERDGSSPNSHSRSSKSGKTTNSNTDPIPETPAPFEGETTLNSQSDYARELLEKAVGSTPSIGQNAEVKAALTSLQAMVSRQKLPILGQGDPQPVLNRALADIDASTLERPAWEEVEDVLQQATTRPTMCFAVVFPFLKMHNLKDIFKDTFGTPEVCSAGRRSLVYGVLYQLFTEFAAYPVDGRKQVNYKHASSLCKRQMEVAMSQLDLFLPATYENILALILSAAYAVEICKPSLCWTLNSMAVSLCQTLGYHRVSSMADDTEEERLAKVHIFWFSYVMDKTLSLRLGRASAIQDWDLSLPFPTSYPNGNDGIIRGASLAADMQLYWIKVAQVQGQVYERLYSAAAFLKPQHERAQIAAELSNALNEAWVMRGDASVLDFMFSASSFVQDPKPSSPSIAKPNESDLPSTIHRGKGSDVLEEPLFIRGNKGATWGKVGDLFYHADAIVHYSTITLIQKAMSPDNNTFNQECLDAARAAIAAHGRANEQFNVEGNEEMWSGYLHWSVLQSPFTPFIVLFCNSLREQSAEDLASLSMFVLSLESCRALSEGADKMYKMCHLFLQVAKLYVETRTKETEAQRRSSAPEGVYTTADGQTLDLSTMTQFDPYLSALGLMPNSAWPMASYDPSMGPQGADGFGAFDGTTGTTYPFTPPGMTTPAATGNQNSLQDWFSGSRYIMGLMEEDILMPDGAL